MSYDETPCTDRGEEHCKHYHDWPMAEDQDEPYGDPGDGLGGAGFLLPVSGDAAGATGVCTMRAKAIKCPNCRHYQSKHPSFQYDSDGTKRTMCFATDAHPYAFNRRVRCACTLTQQEVARRATEGKG